MEPQEVVSPEIRFLEATDLPEVVRLERACFSDPWSLTAFREEIRQARAGGFSRVLRFQGSLEAYMIAWFVADEAHLANIAVAPQARRCGYANILLEDLLDEAQRRGTRVVWLEVRASNVAAIRLYEKHRFRVAGVRKNYYVREREDALVMMRLLSPEGEDDGILVQPQE